MTFLGKRDLSSLLEKPAWGILRTSMTMAGDYTMGILTCLGNKENSDDLYWGIETLEASIGEMRKRIFDLLGNNLARRMFILLKSSQRLGYRHHLYVQGRNDRQGGTPSERWR